MRIINAKDLNHSGKSGRSISPIRWPGGKSKVCKQIAEILPDSIEKIVSPFFGGGSFEIMAGCSGVEVHGYDYDEGLVAFWVYIQKDPENLAKCVLENFFPIKTKEEYVKIRDNLRGGVYKGMMLAAAYYALNRSARSGNVATGGYNNPKDVVAYRRFTREITDNMGKFNCPGLKGVKRMDFRQSIALHPNDFLYLDPPYDIRTPIYVGHSNFPHDDLADILKKRGNWVCFYNNAGDIPKLYCGYRYITMEWAYSMSSKASSGNKKCDEILILSEDFKIKTEILDKYQVRVLGCKGRKAA